MLSLLQIFMESRSKSFLLGLAPGLGPVVGGRAAPPSVVAAPAAAAAAVMVAASTWKLNYITLIMIYNSRRYMTI